MTVLQAPGMTSVLSDLTAMLGDRLSTAEVVRVHHAGDESHHPPAIPDAVAYPTSTAEVARIAELCHAHRVPMIPFGAGTGLEGGVQAMRGGLSIDLGRLDEVLSINAADLDATVQAGVRRLALNAALRETGLFFPVDPGADASIGGMVGTRASGTNAVRYGTMRENVLGLTVVLADGRIVRTGGRARKSSAGYDLTRLFVGSEGTLGIITEVTLRLHPRPETTAVAVCTFPCLSSAVTAVSDILRAGVPLGQVELLDAATMAVARRHLKDSAAPEARDTLFFEFQGSPSAVREASEAAAEITEAVGALAFTWAVDADARERLWRVRRDVLAWARLEHPGAVSWPTDVCVPVSRLSDVISETQTDIAASRIPAFFVGHVGDGNFHCVFLPHPERPGDVAAVEHLSDRLVSRALAAGGTSTGEHGVGRGKRAWLAAEHGEAAVALMAAIKGAVDPLGLLNPGKILPDDVLSFHP